MPMGRVLLLVLCAFAPAWAGPTDVFDVVPVPDARRNVFGPRSLGLQGLHVEPSTILNFDGTVALAYLSGRATDGAGTLYRLTADMRVFQGSYVGVDAATRHGTFGFI